MKNVDWTAVVFISLAFILAGLFTLVVATNDDSDTDCSLIWVGKSAIILCD